MSQPQPKDVSEMTLAELSRVPLSPFEVSTDRDRGYRASNSVSASRLDTPIKDLPFAVQAFTRAFIDDQRPGQLWDIARYSPGVTYRSNDFNEGNANMAIRGFAVSSTAGSAQVLRDGFHGPSIFDFTNIDRVEIVKGPASFLYGQLSPGGIVNVLTKNPQKTFSGSARVRYGSYDSSRLEADVTGPAARGLYYRVAASWDRDIHYWDAYDGRQGTVAPSLLWEPREGLSVSLKYERFAKREDPQIMQKPGYGLQVGLTPTPADPNLVAVDPPGLPDTWNSMADSDYRHSDTNSIEAAVRATAGRHWNVRVGATRQRYTIDALFSGNLGMPNNRTRLQGRRVRWQDYDNVDGTVEGEAVGRYTWRGATAQFLIGGQFIRGHFDVTNGQAPNDPALGSVPTASPLPLWNLDDPSTWDRTRTIPRALLTVNGTDTTTRFHDTAAYGGATIGLFQGRLLVLGGLRRTNTESQITDFLARTAADRFETAKTTPQYGLLYKIRPDVSLFATYAESFVPNPKVLLVRSTPVGHAAPTLGRGYDVGCKTDLAGGRVSGTLTVFEVTNRNIINDVSENDPRTGSQVFTQVQSGTQRSRGVETDVTITPVPGWQLYASYSYMRARITEFSGYDDALLARDPASLNAAERVNYRNVYRFHDAPLQMSAPHLANLWSRYDILEGTYRGTYLAAGANLVFDQTMLPDYPASYYQSYGLLNALAGYQWQWRGQRLSIDLSGRNLAGERYRPSQSTRARPRELLLSLTTSF